MSLRPKAPPPPVPEETRRVARAAFPKGTLCLRIADALGPFYQDSQFAALFPDAASPRRHRAGSRSRWCCSSWRT